MAVDWLIKLWDKGGVPLVMIVLLFLLARFIAKRGVTAFDLMAKAQTESMTKIADAVQASSNAQVSAIGGLTERVSRMEGKVDTLGQLAVREVRAGSGPGFNEMHATQVTRDAHGHPRHVAIASAVEVFDAEEPTPIQGVPILEPQAVPIARTTRAQTPAKGSPYAVHMRPQTKGGKP